jgi:hypothetical protein
MKIRSISIPSPVRRIISPRFLDCLVETALRDPFLDSVRPCPETGSPSRELKVRVEAAGVYWTGSKDSPDPDSVTLTRRPSGQGAITCLSMTKIVSLTPSTATSYAM